MGDAPSAVVGLCALQYARRRTLQIHRRRRHLEAVDWRAAERPIRRQDRHRGCAQQSESPVGGGRRYREPASRPRAAAVRRGAPRRRRRAGGGVYISDDAGATWKLVNSENRLWGRGWYFGSVAVDPKNPDRAYVINTATYMTTDGGKTFVPDQRRARRRRLSPDVGQSQRRQSHGAEQRSGHRGQRGRRQNAGAPGTTSPPRRFITSPPTIVSPIGSTARSRIAAASASAPGRAKACFRSATGSPPVSPAKATPWFPIRRTATFCMAAAPGAAIRT